MPNETNVKILTLDIETAPIEGYVWGLFDQNIGLNQIKQDWTIIAWAAKWYGKPKVMYLDNRKAKDVRDDKMLVKELASLINEADIILTQNGKKFDVKRVNARAVINELPPIKVFSASQHIDIYKEEKRIFGFTSHRLEYKTQQINKKYKKLKHSKYPGFELWKAVLAGDPRAWKEMEKYTKYDVLSTEEHYDLVKGWIKTPNLAVYIDDDIPRCYCGSSNLRFKGYARTDTGKFKRWTCKDCKKPLKGKTNLLGTLKKRSLLK